LSSDPGAGEPRVWFVLHTKSRQEKALARDLGAMGLACYLPLVRRARRHGGRKTVVEEPLFPGYVFLKGTTDEAYDADRTKRVANIIRVPDQRQFEWEVNNIRLALECDAALDPYPHLSRGRKVEVRAGPFRGLQGVVEGRGREARLVLQVDVLGRAVSMEIDGGLLEPVD
jgi:transcription antitermination factor NusG